MMTYDPEVRDAFVYVIATHDGLHKIGLSNEPENRLASLQTAHPKPLTLVHTVRTRKAVKVEKAAHRLLKDQRLSGEWFDVTADVAIDAVNRAAARFPDDVPTKKELREAERKKEERIAMSRAALMAPRPVSVSSLRLPIGQVPRAPGSMLKKDRA